MEITDLVDLICETYELESEAEYGDASTNKYIRDRSIRAKVLMLLEDWEEEWRAEPPLPEDAESLKDQLQDAIDDRDSLLAEISAMRDRL